MRGAPSLPTDRLSVVAWTDAPTDHPAHDPRGRYVEKYWLGILGPSATWLLRHISDELEASPAGFVMDLEETARRIGVNSRGKNSPFVRALGRLVQFEMAKFSPPHVLAVRPHVPSLSRRHIIRLSDHLRAQHEHWQRTQLQDAS